MVAESAESGTWVCGVRSPEFQIKSELKLYEAHTELS